MTEVNLPRMREFVADHFSTQVVRIGGKMAEKALRLAIEATVRIYDHFDAPALEDGWLLLVPVEPNRARAIVDVLGGQPRKFGIVETLAESMGSNCCILCLPDGGFLLWDDVIDDAIGRVLEEVLAYEYRFGVDAFRLAGERLEVPKTFACTSVFAVPAFRNLREALEYYDLKFCRYSNCEILKGVWLDSSRRFLKSKPESTMRRSLAQFLRATLKRSEVRPEQNVDESHPIDIKITWHDARRLALIEIKWLGDSRTDDGTPATSYRDARARDGAQQLADYLDKNKPHVPDHVVRGYLVVFDARRGAPNSNTPTVENLLKYENSEVQYSPQFEAERQDFDAPLRFYMRPIVNGA